MSLALTLLSNTLAIASLVLVVVIAAGISIVVVVTCVINVASSSSDVDIDVAGGIRRALYDTWLQPAKVYALYVLLCSSVPLSVWLLVWLPMVAFPV